MEDLVPFASGPYLLCLGILAFARGMDFFSTWIATPHLVLEGNPLAKKLGWKWGIVLNVVLCFSLALWPMSAIVISTTSILVAARNLQSAWLMRTLGEENYRVWHVARLCETSLPLFAFCLSTQVLMIAIVGAALIYFSDLLVPIAIGMGIVCYAVAVAFYTSLSVWRIRRRLG